MRRTCTGLVHVLGIHSLKHIAQLGVVEAYKRVEAAYLDKVSLNLLWRLQRPAMERIAPDIKEELRKQMEES